MVEGRKVQKVGRSTLAISLPNDWVRRTGLKKGDLMIFSQERDGSIRLVPSAYVSRKTEESLEAVINSDLCSVSKMLERMIIEYYMLGRDTIVITSHNNISGSHVEEIRGAVRKLMGIGIVEEVPNRIVLQCSIDNSRFPISTLMRRMHVNVTTMHSEVTQALHDASRALAQSVTRRKIEIDMFYLLIVRLLLSSQRSPMLAEQIGIEKPIQVQSYRLTTEYLERMSESLYSIAGALIAILDANKKLPEAQANDFSQMSELAKNLCDDVVQSFQSKDARLVNEIIERYESLKSQVTTAAASNQDSYDNELRIHVKNIEYDIRRIVDTGLKMASVALERTLES